MGVTKQYQFDFDRFTVGHLAALQKSGDEYALWAIHDLTVGGIYHLPVHELSAVLGQFCVAYNAFAATVKARLRTTHSEAADSAQDNALRDMLDGIEGL